jgi:type I restriction enzyme S subunit
MSKYEIYKLSGIDWIGEVPKHWQVKRLKNIVLNDIGGLWGDEPADDENDIIVLRVADFDRTNSRIIDNPEFTYRNIRASQLEGRLIKQGDILLEKSGGGEQQPVGKAVLFDKDFRAVTSNFINKIETIPSVNNHFALYLFDALYYNNINVRNIKQTTGIQNLDNTGFFSENISLPPTAEQLTIANYLDDQTQKIDRLIANKKAQAEKLKELRQIEINNAVTKGLNPNAEIKDSGIKWLGEIPKHWETRKISTNFEIIGSGTTPEAGKDDYYDDGKYYFVNTGDLKDCEIFECDKKITEEAFNKFTSLKLFPVNTLLIAMYGATIGKVGILKTEATTNQACCALANSYRFDINYMFYFFIGIREDIIRLSYGGGQPNISQDTIKQLRIPCPPKNEQLEIVKYLQQRTSALDKLSKNIDVQIEKLQELRKIKIYEAVTGKIKVNAYVEATA